MSIKTVTRRAFRASAPRAGRMLSAAADPITAAPAPGAIRGNGDTEVHSAAGIARDRWFHGMHAPPATAALLVLLPPPIGDAAAIGKTPCAEGAGG